MGFETIRAALNVCSRILVNHRQLIEGRDFGLRRSDGKTRARQPLRREACFGIYLLRSAAGIAQSPLLVAAFSLCVEKLILEIIFSVAQLAWAQSPLLVAAIRYCLLIFF